MLILTRRTNEQIVIGDDIRITLVEIRGDKIRIGIEAPKDTSVHRLEVYELIQKQERRGQEQKTNQEKGKDGAK